MLLDKSYFVGVLYLAQLGQKEVSDNLTTFINRLEPDILQAAMGYDLSQAYLEGIDVGSDETADQKWLDISNGCVFTNLSGIKKKWVGFESKTMPSPLAAMVYVDIIRSQASQVSGLGVVKNQSENADAADSSFKICETWNQACRDIAILWELLCVRGTTVYSEYDYRQIDCKYFKTMNGFGI